MPSILSWASTGQAPAAVLPAWRQDAVLNEWFTIADTAGAGGAHIASYSGMALNRATSECIVACAGGHGDGLDNRVVSLDLSADAPSWTVRKAASSTTAADQDLAYYADGAPASRHCYWQTQYSPERSRVFLFGLKSTYPSAVDFNKVDGFDLDTNAWDAAGTWTDVASREAVQTIDHDTGDMYGVVNTSIYKWTQSTATQALLKNFLSNNFARICAWDPVRSQLFSIGFGNGRDSDATKTLAAYKIAADGQTRTAITFNSSAAYTQYSDIAPWGHALEYDPDNDRFLIYSGGLGVGGLVDDPDAIYVVTPNSGSTWDMSLLTLGAGSVAPAGISAAGVLNKFRYVPALKGFVYVNHATDAPVSFIRTA